MKVPSLEKAPDVYARLAGGFFFLEASTAVFGQMFVLGRIVVPDDAVATAANILEHEALFRVGFASSFVAAVFHVAWLILFYELLKPVNRRVSLLAASVMLVGCAIQAIAALLQLAPLIVLQAGGVSDSLTTAQLQGLALLLLRLNAQAFNGHLIIFGVWSALVGYLIVRSRFLPRIIGLLMVIAGLGYVTFLYAPLANALYPFNVVSAAPGEISLFVWLLAKGVDPGEWRRQAEIRESA